MTFIFQHPGSIKLLKEIDKAALNVNSGGGIFAFASKGGIEALFSQTNLDAMLNSNKPFHLVVGVDAITNAEALLTLGEKVKKYKNMLTVHAFFHDCPQSTFHPKFTWFNTDDSLRILTGSGNLTLKGLGKVADSTPPFGNWEAFSVQTLTGVDMASANEEINAWIGAQVAAGTLCQITDEKVRERSVANARVRYTNPVKKVKKDEDTGKAIVVYESVSVAIDGVTYNLQDILIREIPKNRPGQADVGKKALKDFFGYAGTPKDVFIQNVNASNILGPVEEIRLFVNQSQNYRLELHAISELVYEIGEGDARMILIAAKLDPRSFRYMILPITHPEYIAVSSLLGPIPEKNGLSRPMREKRLTAEDLIKGWPAIPNNLVPLTLLTPEP